MAKSSNQIRGLLLFVGVTTLMGVPFLSTAFMVNSPLLFLASCFVAQIALFAGTAPLNSVLVGRAPVGLEAFTQGITIFAIQLFGGALGPILIGQVADVLVSVLAFDQRSALAYALQLSSVALVGSGLFYLWAARKEIGRAPVLSDS